MINLLYICIIKSRTKTMRNITFVIILSLLAHLSLPAQSVDQLIEQFNKGNQQEKINVANSLMTTYFKEGLTEEEYKFKPGIPPDSLMQQVWYWSGEYYYDKQDFKKAVDCGKKALPLCKGTDIEADCLNLLALACFRQSQFDEAATYAKQCYALDEKSGAPDMMSASLNTIAGIYLAANQPKEAEKYILKAIEQAQKVDNPARMSVLQGKASDILVNYSNLNVITTSSRRLT